MSRVKNIAAIDVGSCKIVTLIASIEEHGPLKIIGVANVPSRGMKRGQIVNIEEATRAITESVEAAERMAGCNLNKVYLAVGGPQLISQNSKGVVAVAKPEAEITREDVTRVIEAAKAVSLPASQEVMHVIPRCFTVDGQEGIRDPIGMSGVRLEVETHLITCPSAVVRNLVKCLEELGIEVEALVANGIAATESVLTETEKELGVILVDIGGGTTSLEIMVEGAPFYTATLPIGACNITNDMAIGLRVSLEEAEKMKIDLGKIDVETHKDKKTLTEGIIRPRLNEIFALIGDVLGKSGAAGLTPAGLVVTGGGALTPGILESAKRVLAMASRIGQPQDMVGLIDDVQTPEYAVATGLLKYGWRKGGNQNALSSRKNLPKIPIKGLFIKVFDLVKTFLP